MFTFPLVKVSKLLTTVEKAFTSGLGEEGLCVCVCVCVVCVCVCVCERERERDRD